MIAKLIVLRLRRVLTGASKAGRPRGQANVKVGMGLHTREPQGDCRISAFPTLEPLPPAGYPHSEAGRGYCGHMMWQGPGHAGKACAVLCPNNHCTYRSTK